MTDSPLPKPKSLARRLGLGAIYVLGLGAAVFAAWQGHLAWRSQPAPPPAPRTFALPRPHTATEPAATQPEQLIDSLGGDVQKASGDLKDAPAPPGARPGGAFVLHRGLGAVASYRWEGTIAAGREYYLKTLAGGPWRLVRETAPADGGVLLIFTGNRKSMVVSLRIDAQDAKIVDISVTQTMQ